jgi:hypothetical protein
LEANGRGTTVIFVETVEWTHERENLDRVVDIEEQFAGLRRYEIRDHPGRQSLLLPDIARCWQRFFGNGLEPVKLALGPVASKLATHIVELGGVPDIHRVCMLVLRVSRFERTREAIRGGRIDGFQG